MKPIVVAMFVLVSISTLAQTKDPVTSVIKEMLPRQQKNLTAAAEEMPPGDYDFRPTPAQETFAHLVLHIAQANYIFCSKAGDVAPPKTEELKDTDGKDKLVAGLKASFDFCQTALAKGDDSKLGDEVEGFGGHKQPRAWAWIALTGSWADHYAGEAMYLRLKGLLPPTAQPKK